MDGTSVSRPRLRFGFWSLVQFVITHSLADEVWMNEWRIKYQFWMENSSSYNADTEQIALTWRSFKIISIKDCLELCSISTWLLYEHLILSILSLLLNNAFQRK